MARTRSIKPSFFTNEQLAKLSPLTRLLFVGLWTQADREGRLEDRPKRIKAAVLPFDRYRIEEGLSALVEGGFIDRYHAADGLPVIQIRTFDKHQSPHGKEPPSALPKYTGQSGDCVGTVPGLSGDSEGTVRGLSGDCVGTVGEGSSDVQPTCSQSKTDVGAYSKKTELMHESSMSHASSMHEPSMTPLAPPEPLTRNLRLEPDMNPLYPPSNVAALDAAFGLSTPDGAGKVATPPKVNKSGRVMDLIRDGGVDPILSSRDHGAIKRTSATPELIAEAFLAAHAGTWDPGGNGWLRENLSLWAVIDRLPGYQASKQPIPIRSSGRKIMVAPPKREPTAEERQIEADVQRLMADEGLSKSDAMDKLMGIVWPETKTS